MQKIGNLVLGLGVQVDGIVDKIDKFVLDRLVGARGDRAGAEVSEDAYSEIENLLNGLSGETDLSTHVHQLRQFDRRRARRSQQRRGAQSGHHARRYAGGDARIVSSQRATSVREEFNDRIVASADEINTLSEANSASSTSKSPRSKGAAAPAVDAGGLRVERQQAIDRLSEIVGITRDRAAQRRGQHLGGRRVPGVRRPAAGGRNRNIVRGRSHARHGSICRHQVGARKPARASWTACTLPATKSSATFSTVSTSSPALLAFEFNKIHTQGQGLVGFDDLTSVNSIANADAALDEAGLAFTPVSGHFDLLVYNRAQNITETHDVFIHLDGLDDDTTLNDLTASSTRSTVFRRR